MKSGPTLADPTRSPRRRSAAIKPVATVVLPTPEWVPAITTRPLTVLSDLWVPAPGDRTERSQPGEPHFHRGRPGIVGQGDSEGDAGLRRRQAVGVDGAA